MGSLGKPLQNKGMSRLFGKLGRSIQALGTAGAKALEKQLTKFKWIARRPVLLEWVTERAVEGDEVSKEVVVVFEAIGHLQRLWA